MWPKILGSVNERFFAGLLSVKEAMVMCQTMTKDWSIRSNMSSPTSLDIYMVKRKSNSGPNKRQEVSNYTWPRTALLLRSEMIILRADNMRPLFQEVTKASSKAPIQKSRYQMKDVDVVFLLIPCGLL